MASISKRGEFTLQHDPLTPLDPNVPPNAISIRLLCKELYANTEPIESTLGGGDHGHLGMLMPETEYILISTGAAKYVPAKKPTVPKYAGSDTVQNQQKEDYKELLEAYHEQRSLQDQIQQLLINAVPKVYIAKLANKTRGMSKVTPKQILDHLRDTYGDITSQDLAENLKMIQTPWNPDTPIETVFTNGTECREFAEEGQEPITDTAYIRYLVAIFRGCGVMDKAVEDWDIKETKDQTLDNAIKHFTNMDGHRRRSKAFLQECLMANPAVADLPPAPTDGTLAGFYYCHTHGVATHKGSDCRSPASGHVNDATLQNRQGGVLKFQLGQYREPEDRKKGSKRRAPGDQGGRGGRGGQGR